MNTITLHSDRSSTFSTAIRLILGAFGLMYLIFSLSEYLAIYEFTFEVILNGSLGMVFIFAALFNKKAWDPSTIILNDEFIRAEKKPFLYSHGLLEQN